MPPEELSETLRKKRRRLDKTQGKIADLTGLSVSQISRIEKTLSITHTQQPINSGKHWKALRKIPRLREKR
ncbi:hypothetical protein HRED_07529 [Candidatus Haloredivivus sp. G17]|nr:hypothetical protein HRED_07529 [Candidatus Haloredivivus sp. G17]